MLLVEDESGLEAFDDSIRELHMVYIVPKILRKDIELCPYIEVLNSAALFCSWEGALIRKDELCHFEDGIQSNKVDELY